MKGRVTMAFDMEFKHPPNPIQSLEEVDNEFNRRILKGSEPFDLLIEFENGDEIKSGVDGVRWKLS